MYNYPFMNNSQPSLDRINAQISELEKMKTQLQQPMQPPTSLTQNFQLAPTNKEVIKYASSMEEVEKDIVLGDTPYFSKDMSVVWVKKATGEVKTYELNEIIQKDEKDLKIEFLQAKIDELERKIINEPSYEYANEPIKDEKSTGLSSIRRNKKD